MMCIACGKLIEGEPYKVDSDDDYRVCCSGECVRRISGPNAGLIDGSPGAQFKGSYTYQLDEMVVEPGKTYDKGKPRLDLVPSELMDAVASVIGKAESGEGGKYPLHNWRKGMSWSRQIACALRHMEAWNYGEDLDKESGLHHLAHAVDCIISLMR
jgi:hypothetical protein